jgi:toxin HigB-1
VIASFADADTERIYLEQRPRKLRLPVHVQSKALDKLRMIDAAETLYDFYNPPSNRFEALAGQRKGQYSIRINDRWRICFQFREGNAYEVEIVDYH